MFSKQSSKFLKAVPSKRKPTDKSVLMTGFTHEQRNRMFKKIMADMDDVRGERKESAGDDSNGFNKKLALSMKVKGKPVFKEVARETRAKPQGSRQSGLFRKGGGGGFFGRSDTYNQRLLNKQKDPRGFFCTIR